MRDFVIARSPPLADDEAIPEIPHSVRNKLRNLML